MFQRWMLNIHDFGKIERAEIEISPMMILVGDNNSGKSDTMGLLWGLFSLGPHIFYENKEEIEGYSSYQKLSSWLDRNLHKIKAGKPITLSEEFTGLLVDLLNEVLKEKKQELVSRTFNHELPIGQVYISNLQWDLPGQGVAAGGSGVAPQMKINYEKVMNERYYALIGLLYLIIFNFNMSSHAGTFDRYMYLPAARSGLMQSYKNLIYNLIDLNFTMKSDHPEISSTYKSTLRLPEVRFLQFLSNASYDQKSKYAEVATMIEDEILGGKILVDDGPVPNFTFKAQGSPVGLPPHVTPSAVTELMPLVLLLKSQMACESIIMEEPEAHLHLRHQQSMAKALVRLVNQGLPVWFTTQSDTLFQQINNQIKLFGHSEREALAEQLGYSEQDFLDPAKVSVYQFILDDDGVTRVERLESSRYGFAIPTFNQAIYDLAEETLALEEIDKDAE